MTEQNIEFYKKEAKNNFFLKKYDLALSYLKTAEYFKPQDIDIKKALVETYSKLKDFENANNYAKEVAEIEQNNDINLFILAKTYFDLYQNLSDKKYLIQSFENTKKAYELNQKKIYLQNLLILCLNLNYIKELDEYWLEYLKMPDLNNYDKFKRGIYFLRKGDYKKGFELYEYRFKSEVNPVLLPCFKKPKYKNEDLSSKTILLQYEQGFGDTFIFSRFLYFLKEKANKIILRIPKNLSSIIKRSFPFVEVFNMEDIKADEIEYDYYLPFMSIPFAFNMDKKDIPVFEKYIYADENKVEEFKKLFIKDKNFKIALAYNANPKDKGMRNLDLKEFLPLAEIDGVSLYSIQFADTNNFDKITNLSSYIKDFDDTAALIENMDLIISTDNVVLNLAGAMGKKTFAILNAACDWKWFTLDKKENIWYKTVKYFRAENMNMFSPVIKEIKDEIEKSLIEK